MHNGVGNHSTARMHTRTHKHSQQTEIDETRTVRNTQISSCWCWCWCFYRCLYCVPQFFHFNKYGSGVLLIPHKLSWFWSRSRFCCYCLGDESAHEVCKCVCVYNMYSVWVYTGIFVYEYSIPSLQSQGTFTSQPSIRSGIQFSGH